MTARLLRLVAIVLLAGCGGANSGPNPPPPPPPPPPASVATVTLSRDSAGLVPQFTVQLAATTKDANGNPLTGRPVAWLSSAPAVASVSADGLVTGLTIGTATITATSEGKSGAATMVVRDGAVVGPTGGVVTANGGKAKITIPAGALSTPLPISVTPLPTPPSPTGVVPGTAYELGPDGTSFATPVTLEFTFPVSGIDSTIPRFRLSRFTNGKWAPLAGSSGGRANRTVTAATRSFSTYSVYRDTPVHFGLLIRPERGSVFFGQTLQLTTELEPEVAAYYAGVSATGPHSRRWTGTTGAPVSSTGLVTGAIPGGPYLVFGEAAYTVQCNGGAEPCYLGRTVNSAGDSVDVTAASIEYRHLGSADVVVGLIPVKVVTISAGAATIQPGQKLPLVATLKDSTGAPLSSQFRTVAWVTGNSTIATVSQSGEVTGVIPGTVTISAVAEGVTGTIELTVGQGATDVKSVEVVPFEVQAEVGGTMPLAVFALDQAGNVITGKTVTWRSLDEALATVSSTGIVSGRAVGRVPVTATIDGVASGAIIDVLTPAPLVTGTPSVGGFFACLARSNASIWCWGNGAKGQRGDGTTVKEQATPVRVTSSTGFTAVTAGAEHACGLDAAGKAWCWGGDNLSGQLGDGSKIGKLVPVAVAGARSYVKISAGQFHTCALEADGAAWCWGHGNYVGIGDGIPDKTVPTRVGTSPGFTQISAGSEYTCALSVVGEAWCWGATNAKGGGLGGSFGVGASVPTKVSGGHIFSQVSGVEHFCGAKTNGEVWCWGVNTFGQLGDGSTVNRSGPVRVATSLRFTTVAAGGAITCGLAQDQTAWCWGLEGSNGDARPPRRPTDTQAQSTPVAVLGGRRFTTISVNGNACAGGADGTWCWGGSFDGALGDGIPSLGIVRFVPPVKVRFPL